MKSYKNRVVDLGVFFQYVFVSMHGWASVCDCVFACAKRVKVFVLLVQRHHFVVDLLGFTLLCCCFEQHGLHNNKIFDVYLSFQEFNHLGFHLQAWLFNKKKGYCLFAQ